MSDFDPSILPSLGEGYEWRHSDETRCWYACDTRNRPGCAIHVASLTDEFLRDARPDARDAELARIAARYQ